MKGNNMNGKGSIRRPENAEKIEENWPFIQDIEAKRQRGEKIFCTSITCPFYEICDRVLDNVLTATCQEETNEG